MSIFQGCPGSERIKKPFPEELKCPCGNIVEIWSDEAVAVCKRCKRELTREILPSCLDWCAMAKDCVGEEKYNRYVRQKKGRK